MLPVILKHLCRDSLRQILKAKYFSPDEPVGTLQQVDEHLPCCSLLERWSPTSSLMERWSRMNLLEGWSRRHAAHHGIQRHHPVVQQRKPTGERDIFY